MPFFSPTGGLGLVDSSWAADAKDALLGLQRLVVAVVDVRSRGLKVDLVELLFQHIARVAIAIAASGAAVGVADQGFADQHVQLLSTELLNERMPQAMKGEFVIAQSALSQIAFVIFV